MLKNLTNTKNNNNQKKPLGKQVEMYQQVKTMRRAGGSATVSCLQLERHMYIFCLSLPLLPMFHV